MKYTVWRVLLIFAAVFFAVSCGDNPVGMSDQVEEWKTGAISSVISFTVSDVANGSSDLAPFGDEEEVIVLRIEGMT